MTNYTKNCPNCCKEYITTNKHQKYCSCECANTARTKRSTVTFNCDHCGRPHTQPKSTYHNNRGKNPKKKKCHYCCDNCARLARIAKTFKINCPICNKEFIRRECDLSDCNGKKYKNLYCSRKCKSIGLSGGDEYSPFVYFMGGVSSRMREKGMLDLIDFDKKDLKELWDTQGGICPISGVHMILDTATGRATKRMPKNPYKASLDRIDSSKPYIKNNIQFVCMAINFMKNEFGNDEIIEFVLNTRHPQQIHVSPRA